MTHLNTSQSKEREYPVHKVFHIYMYITEQKFRYCLCFNTIQTTCWKNFEPRQIIKNVFDFFRREKDTGELTIPLTAPYDRTADACGVSISTVRRCVTAGPQLPKKTRTYVLMFDNFQLCAIRRSVYTMYS
jgi:hypothetical protein